ncbi:MAG TPA: LamG-like jellyroll fold domain-containing protein, partial [Verrucomicrobiae bacterium]
MKNLSVCPTDVHPMARPGRSWGRWLSPALTSALMVAASLVSSHLAQAQTPALQFSFEDAPGTSTTNSGSVNVSLNLFNASSVATDLHGAIGSGVLGALNGNRSLNFSNATYVTSGGVNGPSANVINSAALGFGNITSFTATEWFKESLLPPANGLLGRMFILGSGSAATDINAANTIGMKWQQPNQWNVSIGTGNPTATAIFASNLPTNQWLFMAIVYDGTNVFIYQGSDAASTKLISTTAAPGLVENLGASASLYLGNRNTAQRAFAGWIDDFRFYTNYAGSAAFVENIRQQSAPLPTITGIYPDGSRLMQATNNFTFTVASLTGANLTNVSLTLNSVNVSAQLQIVTNGTPGTATNLSLTYAGLPQNRANNTYAIAVADANGIPNSSAGTFDT